MVNIGDTVHFVLPSGRCRPGIVVEHSATRAAQAKVDAAQRALAEAQQAQTSAQARVKATASAVSSAQQSASAATVAPGRSTSVAVLTTSATERLTLAQGLVDALEQQQKAGAQLERAGGEVTHAQANVDAARQAVAAVTDVLDLQVFTLGEPDAGQIFERAALSGDYPNEVALSVVRLAIKRDAGTGQAPGSWHSSGECAV